MSRVTAEAAAPPRGAVRRKLVWVFAALIAAAVVAGAVSLGAIWRSNSLYAQCRRAMETGQWERLEQLGEKLRYWRPNQAAPLVFLAEAASQQGDLENAAALLGELPDDDEMTPPALVERSHLLFGPLNRPLEGAAALERALRLEPRIPEGRRRLIYYYAFTLQRRKMAQHCNDAIDHQCDLPETYVYLMAQDWLSFANAFDENSRWLAGNPDEETFLVARAIYRITSKALDDTAEPSEADVVDEQTDLPVHKRVVAELFERFPQNIELLAYYLKEASTAGDKEEVARLLAKAPADAAKDNRFWRYMGWLHRENEEWLEAEKAYQKALNINPFDYVAHHQLAAVKRRLNKPQEVETLEALARDGQNLRREILQLPDVTSASPDLLNRMANHIAACGEGFVANKLYQRIQGGG